MYGVAIAAAKQSDEDRLATTLHRLVIEDPTLAVHHDDTTGQTVLSGGGETHVRVALSRIERAGVELVLDAQRERVQRAQREGAVSGGQDLDRARVGDGPAADTSIASWRGDLDADAVDELILRLCRRDAERGQRCSIHVLAQDRAGRPRLAGTLADAPGPVRLGFSQVDGWRPLIVGEGRARRDRRG